MKKKIIDFQPVEDGQKRFVEGKKIGFVTNMWVKQGCPAVYVGWVDMQTSDEEGICKTFPVDYREIEKCSGDELENMINSRVQAAAMDVDPSIIIEPCEITIFYYKPGNRGKMTPLKIKIHKFENKEGGNHGSQAREWVKA